MPREELFGRFTGLKQISKKSKDRLTRLNAKRKRINKNGKTVNFPVASPDKFTVVDYRDRYAVEDFKSQAFASRATEFKQLKENAPVLMMPVRLETKFYLDDNPPSLKIRIFPDQIMVEDHDERLSVNEYEAGRSYWFEYKKLDKAGDQEGLDNLWTWLVSKVGPNRAPYVAKQSLKEIPANKLRKGEEYTVSQSQLLPDKWLVVGYRNNTRVLEAYSRLIKQDIAFSPDFAKTNVNNDDVSIDPAVEWMFDFDKAVINGMAVNITYNPTSDQEEIKNIRDHGFDELYVVGIKLRDPQNARKKLTLAKASNLLESTLEAHLYSRGAGFVPQGMPTNNTEDVNSGWSAFKPDTAAIKFREFDDINSVKAKIFSSQTSAVPGALIAQGTLPGKLAERDKNYAVLNKALGLKATSVLKRFEYREGYEQRLQRAMNGALWPVTWGEYLESLFSHDGTPILEPAHTKKIERWFQHNVRGGTSIPCIRVGETPYGILPVQSFGAMNHESYTDKRERELLRILKNLLAVWMGEKGTLLQMTDNPQALSDPGEVFVELLSRFPLPMQFHGQKLYDDEWIIKDIWYALCKAAITDVEHSDNAEFVDGLIQTNLTTLKNRKFSSMEEQWDVFEDLRAEVLVKRTQIANLGSIMGPALANQQIAKIDEYLSSMDIFFDVLSDQSLRGQIYDVLDVPHNMVNGSMDPNSPNPRMVYSRFKVDVETWPEDQYVIVNRDEKTVTPEAYIAYLKQYIDSQITANTDAGEAPFPDAQKPLLYHLLLTAISRIIVDNDETAIILGDMVDFTKAKGSAKKFEADFKAVDSKKIESLNNALSLAAKNSSKKEAKNVHAVLKYTSANELKAVSSQIKTLTKKQAKNANYPKKEMQALSKNIDTFVADASKLNISKKKIITEKPRKDKLKAFKTHLEFLEKAPWHQLELLMQQSLSLAGWRLDAWFNSFHTAQLNSLRTNQETGNQIGAFGWVHNLKPRESEIGTADVSDGFIHTPSLNHAKTAAVLRAGWNAYKEEQANEALAVDLSSERVRLASWLFDAVRQGQDLGDVLGYRFERFLHENKLDYWVMPIRMAVLEITQEQLDPKSPVVDGMELMNICNTQGPNELFKKAKKHFKGTPPAISEISDAIAHLDKAVDSMGDAAIADSVHAMVQGNAMRAGASLSAISNGEVLPPELQAIKTQRRGKACTHRTMLVQTADAKDYGWFERTKDFKQNIRAQADPEMERLVCSLLNGPEQVRFETAFVDNEGAYKHKAVISLKDVFENKNFILGAQDVLAMLGEEDADSSILEEWVLCWLQDAHSPFIEEGLTPVILSSDDPEELNETDKTRLWLAGWRDLIGQARALNLDDFRINGEDGKADPAKVDIEHLENRMTKTLDYFQHMVEIIRSVLPLALATETNPYPVGQLAVVNVKELLLQLAKIGVPMTIPQAAADEEQEKVLLYAQLWSAYDVLLKRFENLPVINKPTRDTDERIKNAREVIQVLLGKNCKVTVNFAPENASVIAASFTDSNKRVAKKNAHVFDEWLEKMQYVEPNVRLFSEARLVHDMSEKPALKEMVVGQWPHIQGEAWAGENPKKLSQRSYVSVLACPAAPFDVEALANKKATVTGLRIHESLEYVPAEEEDTAVAMHFDAPNTEAPQTMLLAMAPKGQNWDFDLMIDTLRDTFEWVQLRTIDNVEALAHHMPAIFASRNISPGLPPDQEGSQ